MKYLQKLFSRKFYRSILFWVLSLLTVYTLGGFFVLPNIINKTIVEQVDQQLGWQTDIEKIKFNPYALTLAINNLKISDQQAKEQISFKHYYMNFELRSIIEGAFTFADIELLEPKVNVELDKEGVSNFQYALQQQLAKNPPLPEEKPEDEIESPLIKLLFDNINLIDGSINIVDNTPTQPVKYQLNPITFNLKDLFTYGDEESTYRLNLSLGNDQTITWDGKFAIAPLRSEGSLKINGFRVHDFWNYVAEQVPYTLQNALVGISGKYEFSMANESMQLNINQAAIQVNKIKVANKEQQQSFVDIDAINIGPLDFNLGEKQIQISALKIDAIDLKVERDKQGLINLLAPFTDSTTQGTPEAANSKETTTEPSPFKWSIDDITLNESQITFTDNQPSTTAETTINKINFAIQGVNQDLSTSLPFNLAYSINQAGETEVNGKVTTSPLDLKAHINIKELGLPALQPYISDLAKVNLEKGKLSVSGDVNLSNDKQGQIQGDFQGAFNIDEFNTKDTLVKQRLVGWQHLAIDPIKINFNPLSIAINKIAIAKPYSRLVITKDRSINLAQLAIDKSPQSDGKEATDKTPQKVKKSADDQTEAEQPIDITIDNITITDGGAYFADLSLQPEFGTSIQNISGEINGLSSKDLTRADVNISGSVEEYGKMFIKGKINPLSGDLYTDINVNFDKIELASLTPYSGRYVGYAIDKGKISLDLNYKIANNTLDAKNHLTLDQFELGQTINSDEALSLPLKLALALLTDVNGVIDIKLPITGDMNSPDFAIGGLLVKTFVNLLTKAVTSPFSMMANLVGGDPDKMKSLAFKMGSSTLSEDNIEQIKTLASVLKSRPNLILEVRSIVDENQDGLALRQQKLQALLLASGIDSNIKQSKRISKIEKLFTQYDGEAELDKLENEMKEAIAAVKEGPEKDNEQQLITDGYEQSLQQFLLDKQPLSNLELTNLAQQRVNTIKTQLIKQEKVENKQVFALQPSLKGKAEENTISTIFTLTNN